MIMGKSFITKALDKYFALAIGTEEAQSEISVKIEERERDGAERESGCSGL